MKKKILALATLLVMAVSMTGCNRNVLDVTWKFEKAIVTLPNGEVIEGKCSNWRDYQDSDMVQVEIDGVTYFTHSNNIVLISED
jgi:hypothetical protein